jgi:hypothetical protein
MCFKIGDWEIIQFIDYEDEGWSYEHIYQHADGRQAVVGPGGYCSDPDLSWLLHQRARKEKQMARIKLATQIFLNAAWLPVGIQALQQCLASGLTPLVSVLGYAICCLSAYGGWRALIPPGHEKRWKDMAQMLVICGSLFLAGVGLIGIGSFTAITLGSLQMSLALASVVLGLAGCLACRWRQISLST